MRWLEKVYRKVADRFQAELSGKHGLNAAEIEICKVIATEDQAPGVRLDRQAVVDEGLPSKKGEVGNCQVEGAL